MLTSGKSPLLKDRELNKMKPESYHPIALLPTLSKIVERVAQCQLLKYMEETGQLNTNSHAYKQTVHVIFVCCKINI